MKKFSSLSFLVLLTLIIIVLPSCRSKGGGTPVAVTLLTTISVTPSAPVIGTGQALQFMATGIYSNGTITDLTEQVTWSELSGGTTATIGNSANNRGLLTSLASGTTAVTASYSTAFGVMTGSVNLVVTSSRANNWTVDIDNALLGLSSSGPQWVTVGQGIIMTAPTSSIPNTITWNVQSSPTMSFLWDVTWSDTANTFVAVGESGVILTSPSGGTAWTPRASGTTSHLWGVTWSTDLLQFIAVGSGGTILTSPNGVLWTASTQTVTSVNLNGVAALPGPPVSAVAVGDRGTILTTSDGAIWSQISGTLTTSYLMDVVSNGSKLVAVGSGGTIISSTTGSDWIVQSSGANYSLLRVAWSPDLHLFAAVGTGGTILTSHDDGINPMTPWVSQSSGTSNSLWSIACFGKQFVAVGLDGTILTSTDGVAWTRQTTSTLINLNDVGKSDIAFAGVGRSGNVMTSVTGSIWTIANAAPSVNLNSVASSGIQFTAVGKGGVVVTSPEGKTVSWTTQTSSTTNTTNDLNGIAWSGNHFDSTSGTVITQSTATFVAVGANGTVITQPTGTTTTTWTLQTTPPLIATNNLNSVAWSEMSLVFVAVGDKGTIITSPDGISWTQQTSPTGNDLTSVAWTGTEFVAVDVAGGLISSLTGTTWKSGP